MNRRTVITVLLAFAGVGALIFFLPQSYIISDYSGTRTKLNQRSSFNQTETNGYLVSFPLDTNPRGLINCYMLRYRPNTYETARRYAEMFIEIETFYESDRAFVFSGMKGTVFVDKEINKIHFEATRTEEKGSLLESDEEAIAIAADFLERRSLILIYEEAQVYFDGYTYRVSFINRISNLKNYAFPNKVTLDNFGRILTLDYFTVQYDRVGQAEIKSMKEAFNELPDLEDGETVLILSAQLVYIFEDSIIQPAYYFQGYMSDDRVFECFVKAAVF